MINDEMINEIANIPPIEWEQIPDIDLYMDQVLTFLDEKLKYYKRTDDEKLLTKTMINNYSKDKVLPPSKNKKYSKAHMVRLILVYHMKSILTINDIAKVVHMMEQGDEGALTTIYQAFNRLQEHKQKAIADEVATMEKTIADMNIGSKDGEKALMILSLMMEANMKKQLAQKMIDEMGR